MSLIRLDYASRRAGLAEADMRLWASWGFVQAQHTPAGLMIDEASLEQALHERSARAHSGN